MSDFTEKLKAFLHDPVDKCFEIPAHIQRAKEYAEIIGINEVDKIKGPDEIAACMERSFLPRPEKYGLNKEHFYQAFNEIRHPLSEEKIIPLAWDKDEIFKKVRDVLKNLNADLPYNDREKFLYLWRNLVEKICEGFKDSPIGKFIPIFPADTRIPDHSIWEHLKIASAINSSENMQNNSLFLFSIGPVQSFISQARKTQDLFMGSFILSFLTFKAIEVVIDKYGPTNIIYPDLWAQPLMDYYLKKNNIVAINSFHHYIDQPTIPNRFVALIPLSNNEEINNFASEVEKNIRSAWQYIVEKVLKTFELNKKISSALIEKQNKNFPEIYWTAIPLKIKTRDVIIKDFEGYFKAEETKRWEKLYDFIAEEGEFEPNVGLLYQLAYSALEKSMGARKNLRDFEQTEEHCKKCHICGEREGVIKADQGSLKSGKYISSKESLCVLCFTKRALDKYLGNDEYLSEEFRNKFKDFSFPSTAEIASSDFKERALEEAKQEFKDYINAFKKILGDKFQQVKISFIPKLKKNYSSIENIDGDWFFEENLREKEFDEQFEIKPDEQKIKYLKDKLKAIIDRVGEASPYYGVIMLDGDFMGEWLSGEKLPSLENAYNSEICNKLPDEFKKELKTLTNGRKILTPAVHASISHALRNHSIEFVRKIVEEEHFGKIVYAGGDDLLAFVNLKDLLEVIRKLRASFSGHIRFENCEIKVDWSNSTGFVEKDDRYLLTMGAKASSSAGIVIAHYKAPLKIVLDRVREMEKKAKKLDSNKDAFAIALMKHSGQVKEFVCKWKYVDDKGKEKDMIEKIEKIGNYFKKDSIPKLSSTFPYKLYGSLHKLMDKNGIFCNISGNIFKSEVIRTLKKSMEGGSGKEIKNAVNEIAESLQVLFWHSGLSSNIDKFINLLEFTKFTYLERG